MNGLLYLAFGEKFDVMAAQTIAYSQQFTHLPITVLTNIKTRCPDWEKTKDVNFVYIESEAFKNRQYKTTMIDFTPYENTLYMDVDSVIQKSGIENVFDKLDGYDLMLNLYGKWVDRIPLSYYRQAMKMIGIIAPLTVFYGAFIGFTKSEGARKFFKRWNENWKKSGIAREMPALACTVKQMSELKLVTTGNNDKFFTWPIRDGYYVQHEYGAGFWRKFFPKII